MAIPQSVSPVLLDATALFDRWQSQDTTGLADARRRCEAARDAMIAAADGSLTLPDCLLLDYQQQRRQSDLGRVLKAAPILAAGVDRVVVLGDGDYLRGVEALFAACCHPRHNDLSRGERGGQPRIYCLDIAADNDAAAGLLDLFAHPPAGDPFEHRWALVTSGDLGGSMIARTNWRRWIEVLWGACGSAANMLAERLVLLSPPAEPLGAELPQLTVCSVISNSLGIRDCQSPFTPASLLVAALAGMDIVKLLRGVAAMSAQFRELATPENAPLMYAMMIDLLCRRDNLKLLALCPQTIGLAAIARWVEGLLLDQYQRNFGSPLAITLPVGRDMAALHEEFLGLRLVVSGVRRDRLAPADVAEPSSEMPPSAMPTLRLPLSDESSVAQSMQFFLLATELLNHLAERG